jgi:hypothetical protein
MSTKKEAVTNTAGNSGSGADDSAKDQGTEGGS